ncbi:MAG TPA: D-alanine--D-alanine ligase family protein [Thermomicrobiales bacterium]|nr:D-alanine--D-alanine ligase family protein [Thermomicrobiales bacterium]
MNGGTSGQPGSASGKVRVAILFGGQSDEHDVSLRSAETIMNVIDGDKYEVTPIGITREGRWLAGGDPMAQLAASSPLFAMKDGETRDGYGTSSAVATVAGGDVVPSVFAGNADVVFPVLHGPCGEDGTVQGMLELAGIPYVGAGVLGSAVAMDKAMTKTILDQAGLPQAPWRLLFRRDWEREPGAVAEWIADAVGYPCFVKPANMGSSVGITKVHDPSELATGIGAAARLDRRIVIEQAVDCREFEVAVLGNDEPIASVAGEVVPCNEFYDYNAKYVDDRSELIIPADLEGKTMVQLQELAVDAFRALDLSGMARVDFFLDRTNDHIYVNEVNTIPGFTSISMYPRLWEATGIPLAELVDRLIGLALERHTQKAQRP